MTTCASFAHWTLKGSALAREGMGNCQYLPRCTYTFQSCERIKPADASVVEARVAWLSKHEKTKGTK